MKFTTFALIGSFASSTLAAHGHTFKVRGNSTKPDVGKQILDKAMTAAGVPYAWGGGSCDGPSEDQPPYQYGDTGYDCSGLVCWAVCQITGRDLFTEGLRVTSDMYCASEKDLKYKSVPSEIYIYPKATLTPSIENIPTRNARQAMPSSLAESVIAQIGAVSIMLD